MGFDINGMIPKRQGAKIRPMNPGMVHSNNDAIESALGQLLQETGKTIAVAESCTGGKVSEMITSVPGSSRYFVGGWVTYSNEAKQHWLGVPMDLLSKYGAVSREVARAMAECARIRSGADLSVAITGIAGPSGATLQKPIGLVFIAVATHEKTIVEQHLFTGSREDIRRSAATAALSALYQAASVQHQGGD